MRMLDALFPGSIPAGTACDIAAAYIDHSSNPSSFAQMQAKFPNAVHVKISVAGTVGADVLDCESGTGRTPADAVAWVQKSRAAGIDPTVYCNQHMTDMWGWGAYRAAFAAAHVPEPHWWVADYDGDPTVPAGAVAKQYTDRDAQGNNTFDTSATITGWPTGTPTGDDMTPAESAMLTDLHNWLSGGVAAGQTTTGGTIAATLRTVQSLTNQLNALSGQVSKLSVGGGSVDPAVLAQAIAQHIALVAK